VKIREPTMEQEYIKKTKFFLTVIGFDFTVTMVANIGKPVVGAQNPW
jgi:hypothetical protein